MEGVVGGVSEDRDEGLRRRFAEEGGGGDLMRLGVVAPEEEVGDVLVLFDVCDSAPNSEVVGDDVLGCPGAARALCTAAADGTVGPDVGI